MGRVFSEHDYRSRSPSRPHHDNSRLPHDSHIKRHHDTLLGNMNVREGIVNSHDNDVSSLCYSKPVENTPRKQERCCGNLPIAEDNESKYKETDWADTKCSFCQTKLTDTIRTTLDDNT